MSGRHLLVDLARTHDLERQLNLPLVEPERRDGARHEAGAQRRERADGQTSEPERLEAADAVLDHFQAGEVAVHFHHQRHSLLCRHEPPPHALEQAQLAGLLELAQRLAHRRLRHAQQVRSLAGGAGAHHRAKDLDVALFHP
ncbi:hypothetical protein D3C85_1505640 [compost metagenome]